MYSAYEIPYPCVLEEALCVGGETIPCVSDNPLCVGSGDHPLCVGGGEKANMWVDLLRGRWLNPMFIFLCLPRSVAFSLSVRTIKQKLTYSSAE